MKKDHNYSSKWRSLSNMDLHSASSGSSTAAAAKRIFGSTAASGGPSATAPLAGGANGFARQDSVSSGSHASGGNAATNGHQYELIKSTQSLVERLNLNAQDITIQSVHPSIIGQDTWFQITYTSTGTTRYFSCQSPKERDEWIASLKKTLMMNEDRRRTDNSLRLDVLEVKGLPEKKKYYAEILVDDKLYARTSAKKLTCQCCFWGEQFEFKDLPQNADRIGILIHKEKSGGSGGSAAAGKRKKPKKPVGRVKISISAVKSRYIQDKWYPVEKTSRRDNPSIRLRCQSSSVDILPLRDYEDFLYFLRDEYKSLCRLLEPNISVKVKEELSTALMNIFHSEDMAEDVLADIVVDEISSVENEHLTFRGNSIATKAMESYIKLVGQKYLQDTLHSVLAEIIHSEMDLEIDPVKVTSMGSTAAAAEALTLHRTNLTRVVRQVWNRIANSHALFPVTLQRCFYKIRQFLLHVGKPDVGDNLISACIFLRYLCPAILAPSLFNLTDEYPSERANRNLTLVAKTLQTLANFTRYEGKENSMEFLNPFLEEESVSMKNFLRQISSPLNPEDGWISHLSGTGDKSELGRHLSILHTILFENVSKVPSDSPIAIKLRQLLDDINSSLDRPTIPQLERISQSTLDTLKQNQGATTTAATTTTTQQPQASSSSSANSDPSDRITLPWGLGTLPKPMKKTQPAPHHKTPGIFGTKPNTLKQNVPVNPVVAEGISHPSDTSSSSASLTPSPGGKERRWAGAGGSTVSGGASSSSGASVVGGGRHAHPGDSFLMPHPPPPSSAVTSMVQKARSKYQSQMSLDETDSSDDSTYSSQYQSDANSTPICHASTLPRQMVGGAHGHYSTTSRIPAGGHHHHPHLHHHPGPAGSAAASATANNGTKSLSDYEQEILELRSAMEQLQIKLGEAEMRLQSQGTAGNPNEGGKQAEPQAASQTLKQLLTEEDLLRRGPLDKSMKSEEKEKMIQLQHQKVAVLDEASHMLAESLNAAHKNKSAEATPKNTPIKQRVAISSTLVSVNTSPPAQVELSGAKTVTAINTTPSSLHHHPAAAASPSSTSPQPSTTSSSSVGLRRFGSPSSTISSASSTSSNTKSSPNRSITVITNGQAVTPVKDAAAAGGSPTKFITSNHSVQLPPQPVDSTPKTVDELLDSLHSTPI